MDRSCELPLLVKAKHTSILQSSTMTKFADAVAVAELPKISSQKHLRAPPPCEGRPPVWQKKKRARVTNKAAKGLSLDFFEISIGGFTFTFTFTFAFGRFCKSQC
ncbi:hypothetical protein BT93_B0209 [Corymbia citriodora subsp. variegata]|nr:hypothetical protein BT93_B0209 [Corymbia citriodora subsp. variegata]